MTEEPLGRKYCSKETKAETEMSAVLSALKSRPKTTLPEADRERLDIFSTTPMPLGLPVPMVRPVLPNVEPVAVKLMTGGGPVWVEAPVLGALEPLMATSMPVVLSVTPLTPTRATELALARSA